MKRVILLFVIGVPLAGYGTFLAAGGASDDRSLSYAQRHLDILQGQLSGLKSHLLKHRQAHGRYPTNDEGLAELDNFETKLDLYFLVDSEPDSDRVPLLSRFAEALEFEWQNVARQYRADRQKDASAARGSLARALGGRPEAFAGKELPSGRDSVKLTVALGDQDEFYLLTPAGILSPWGLLYTFENRVGLDAAKFEGSPANRDSRGRYSIRVDGGVYLCAADGEVWATEVDRRWWELNRPRLFGGILLCIAATLPFFLMVRSGRARSVLGASVLLVSAGAGYGVHELCRTTCYIMSPLFIRRTPEMVSRQKELLDAYHARGVISDVVYQRSVAALSAPVTTRPASAPER